MVPPSKKEKNPTKTPHHRRYRKPNPTQPKERRNMNTSMQQKKPNNKGEEPGKINASFTNLKIEEKTKQQGNVRYSGTNGRRKKTKPTQRKCHMAENKREG